jgi:hypothetical protein
MKTNYLLPTYFRPLGFILAIPGLILGFLFLFYGILIPDFGPPTSQGYDEVPNIIDNYTNELALTLIIVGIMFIAFAKLKNEDELTAQLRLNALYWAILVNYALLTVVAIALNGNEIFIGFRHIRIRMLDYSAFVLLIVFLIRFYYLLHKSKDEYVVAPLRFLPYRPFNKIVRWVVVPCICLFIPRLICDLFYPDFFELKPLLVRFAFVSYFILPVILLTWMYSKERVEDEYINFLRLRAMQIAIYINCIVLLLGNFIFSGTEFLYFETGELSILPLIFVIIFQYSLCRLSRNIAGKTGQALNLL